MNKEELKTEIKNKKDLLSRLEDKEVSEEQLNTLRDTIEGLEIQLFGIEEREELYRQEATDVASEFSQEDEE